MPAEPPSDRLFIALTLPPPVRAALAALAEPMAGVNWTRPDHLHLTLRFLGDVAATQQDGVIERLAAIRVNAFILPVEGVGSFPPNRPPRVIWTGVGQGHPRLFQLRQRIDDALLGAGLALDVRTFHPHATLARCTENAATAVTSWVRAHREFTAPPFRVESFDLYASELRPKGAEHTLKQSFPLAD
jgi:2'-5' RNA ligase